MQRQKGSSHSVFGEIIGRAILLSLVVLLAGVDGRAQHGADRWFFGNGAGLDFSTGVPVPSAGALSTIEGSAVMSDPNGNLLFYTDGQTVWNRNHLPMQNGTGLLGASSSTQSALIVPWPKKECKMYYIFTVQDAAEGKHQTLNYSLVNLNSAGGLGAVTSLKNIQLKPRVSEKLTAVADADGTGFWVLAHGFDVMAPSSPVNREFYVYHVGASGLDKNGVAYKVDSAHSGITAWPAMPHHASQGQMKVSPDGKLIACAVRSRFVEIVNFDTTKGVVSGPARIFTASNKSFISSSVYGVEFSPDSKLLYVSVVGGTPNQLLQLVLANNGSWSQLYSSTSPGPVYFYDLGALQSGPDKKIYVARYNRTFISVINQPQTAGVGAQFTNGPALPPGATSKLGLPTIVQGDFSCAGDGSREECCDKLTVTPVMTTPNLTIDTKTFTVSNLKTPVSAICSIDINLSPAPPSKQGGGLAIDGTAVPAGTRFVAPYNRLPNAGAPTISATNTVKFNLSIPNSPRAVYTVTLVVKHCDGTQCILTYSPWPTSTSPDRVDPRRLDHDHQFKSNNFTVGGKFVTQNTRRNSGTTPGFGGWLTYNLPGPFAVTGEVDFFPRKSSSSSLDGDLVLQAFAGGKIVKQFDDFAVYGKFGPGVQRSRQVIKGFTFRDERVSGVIVGENNLFALQSSGGVELCPSSRFFTSIDAGIVSTRRTNRFEFVNSRPVSVPAFWENNLQFSYSVGYRFRLGGWTP